MFVCVWSNYPNQFQPNSLLKIWLFYWLYWANDETSEPILKSVPHSVSWDSVQHLKCNAFNWLLNFLRAMRMINFIFTLSTMLLTQYQARRIAFKHLQPNCVAVGIFPLEFLPFIFLSLHFRLDYSRRLIELAASTNIEHETIISTRFLEISLPNRMFHWAFAYFFFHHTVRFSHYIWNCMSMCPYLLFVYVSAHDIATGKISNKKMFAPLTTVLYRTQIHLKS